jgi:hypothetical protein
MVFLPFLENIISRPAAVKKRNSPSPPPKEAAGLRMEKQPLCREKALCGQLFLLFYHI